jgi:hypothetical protein
MSDVAASPVRFTRAPELRSIANSIEPMFPSAADMLRGIARELEEASSDE